MISFFFWNYIWFKSTGQEQFGFGIQLLLCQDWSVPVMVEGCGKWNSNGLEVMLRPLETLPALLWALEGWDSLMYFPQIAGSGNWTIDAKLVVDLLKKEVGNPNGNDAFVADCREGLKEIPLIRVQHCYWEANKCANALARKGALLSQDFVVLVKPPSDVALLRSFDFIGTMYDRHVYSFWRLLSC